ncbi:hypothetical protein MG293_001737 [Ovis ammon polii]|uniref:Nucleoside-diphosphate kinase n=1 Tax=Ovis ammon polii TaxID=230172 RepID=A0AAD4UMU8_OVIAM|nr:hypothetical protein MG293_001737 [Ovis ammon polii]
MDYFCQFDADRDEDEVFYDISMAVDSKLFPNKEAAAGSSDLDPSMMLDTGEIIDTGSDYEDQGIFPTQGSYDISCIAGYGSFILSQVMRSPFFLSFRALLESEKTYVVQKGDDQLNVFGEDTMGGFMEDLKKCKIIFMIGGPGSGKGTQCGKLAEKYGFTHLSTGDLLRNELSSGSERSKLIRDITDRGELVPSGIILELLKEAMVASLSNTKGFLIDGYPREVKQGEEFGRRIGDPHLVICMDCSADTMTNRLLQRSRSSPQADSSTTTIAKRLEAYYRASIPVVAYYETKTQLHKKLEYGKHTASTFMFPQQIQIPEGIILTGLAFSCPWSYQLWPGRYENLVHSDSADSELELLWGKIIRFAFTLHGERGLLYIDIISIDYMLKTDYEIQETSRLLQDIQYSSCASLVAQW